MEIRKGVVMIKVSMMSKKDISTLYEIALRAFASDYEKFDVYPPVINLKKRDFYHHAYLEKQSLKTIQ